MWKYAFAFAPLNDVKTFDNADQEIDLIHTIDPDLKQEPEQLPDEQEEPVVIQIKEDHLIRWSFFCL